MRYFLGLFLLLGFISACSPQAPSVSSVAVSGPANNALRLGEAVQFIAAAKDAGGNTLEGKTFTWSSSDTTVAAVAADGKVSGIRNGKVKISATADGVKGESVEQTAYGLEFIAGVSLEPSGDTVGTTFAFRLRLMGKVYEANVVLIKLEGCRGFRRVRYA